VGAHQRGSEKAVDVFDPESKMFEDFSLTSSSSMKIMIRILP
jgi:hypothetical protein